jgi:hypothetical protein
VEGPKCTMYGSFETVIPIKNIRWFQGSKELDEYVSKYLIEEKNR